MAGLIIMAAMHMFFAERDIDHRSHPMLVPPAIGNIVGDILELAEDLAPKATRSQV